MKKCKIDVLPFAGKLMIYFDTFEIADDALNNLMKDVAFIESLADYDISLSVCKSRVLTYDNNDKVSGLTDVEFLITLSHIPHDNMEITTDIGRKLITALKHNGFEKIISDDIPKEELK